MTDYNRWELAIASMICTGIDPCKSCTEVARRVVVNRRKLREALIDLARAEADLPPRTNAVIRLQEAARHG